MQELDSAVISAIVYFSISKTVATFSISPGSLQQIRPVTVVPSPPSISIAMVGPTWP